MKMDKTTTSRGKVGSVSLQHRAASWLRMSQTRMKCWKEVFLPWSRGRVQLSRQRDHVSRSRLCLWCGSELASGLKAQPGGHWLNGIKMVLGGT